MDATQSPRKSKRRNNGSIILFIFLIASLLLNLFQYYMYSSQKSEMEGLMADQKKSYEKDLTKLEDKLEDQIKKAKNLRNQDQSLIDSLESYLENIKNDKATLQNSLRATQAQLTQYKEKITAYEILLREKDKMIDELRETNEILYAKNTDLKKEKMELTGEITEREKNIKRLSGKVAEAQVLRAENVIVNAVTSRGKTLSGGQYRAKKIGKLALSFNFSENNVAKIGNKEVFMRILEPAGTVLANQGQYGKFDLNGKDMIYTARQVVLFDNSRQNVGFQFKKSDEFRAGRHTVEFYCEGHRIGYGTFEVR